MLKEILLGFVILIGVLYFVDNLRWYALEGLYGSQNTKFCLFDGDCYPSYGCVNMVAAVKKYGARNITLPMAPSCKCIMRNCMPALLPSNSSG